MGCGHSSPASNSPKLINTNETCSSLNLEQIFDGR
ncbi:unnamed protein product, partial [Rotaria magnacalcarata]